MIKHIFSKSVFHNWTCTLSREKCEIVFVCWFLLLLKLQRFNVMVLADLLLLDTSISKSQIKIYNMQRMDQDLQVTLALVKYCWLKWSKSRVCNRNTLFTFNWTQVDDQSPQWGHEERHEIHTDILFTVCGDPELLPHYTQRLKTQWILLNLNTDGPIMSSEDITISL